MMNAGFLLSIKKLARKKIKENKRKFKQ